MWVLIIARGWTTVLLYDMDRHGKNYLPRGHQRILLASCFLTKSSLTFSFTCEEGACHSPCTKHLCTSRHQCNIYTGFAPHRWLCSVAENLAHIVIPHVSLEGLTFSFHQKVSFNVFENWQKYVDYSYSWNKHLFYLMFSKKNDEKLCDISIMPV